MKEISKNAKMTPLFLLLDEEGLNKLNMMAENVYKQDRLEFPKENEFVRFIDKDNNVEFEAKITNVKEGKTSIDKTIEIEKLN
jgi:hypothetical protein